MGVESIQCLTTILRAKVGCCALLAVVPLSLRLNTKQMEYKIFQ